MRCPRAESDKERGGGGERSGGYRKGERNVQSWEIQHKVEIELLNENPQSFPIAIHSQPTS